MSINQLRDKLARLQEAAGRHAEGRAEYVEGCAAAALAELPAFITTTSTYRAALMLDTVYAVLRHHAWLNNELFSDALTAFLAAEYRLAASTAAALVHAVRTGATAGSQFVPASGTKDFLRYLFVMSATTRDQPRLVADLGLGKELLTRVGSGVSRPQPDGVGARAGAVFAAPFDAEIAEALAELAAETGGGEAALDAERLRFALFEATFGRHPLLPCAAARHVFAALVELGVKRVATEHVFLNNLADAADESKASAGCKSILENLATAGLIFAAEPKRWELTPAGQALTGAAFAAAMAEAPWPSPAELSSINAHYQERLVERHPALNNETLIACIETMKPMAPRTLHALIQRVVQSGDTNAAARLAEKLRTAALPPWLAGAAKDILAAHTGSGTSRNEKQSEAHE